MTCTFFGHRDTPQTVKPLLREVLMDLIEHQGVTRFYVGNQGSFDRMAADLLKELSEAADIRYEIVLAYMPKTNGSFDEAPTILPDGIEAVPPRFAIEYRNKWMIERSDIVVTYVRHSFGGAAKFKDLGVKKNKTVIEL